MDINPAIGDRVAPGGIVRKGAFVPVIDCKLPFTLSHKEALKPLTLQRWFNLGGTIEEGETPEQAVVRESFEEGDIVVDPTSLRLIDLLTDDQCYGFVEGTRFEMYLFDGRYTGTLRAKDVAKIELFTIADKHRTTPMGGKILDWFSGQGLID